MCMVDYPDTYQLKHRMESLRKQMRELLRDMYVKHLASLSAHYVDQMALGQKVYGEYRGQFVLSKTASEIEERDSKIEKTGLRDPFYDYHCSVSILPIKDKILVMPFCDRREIIDLLRKQPWLIPYGYWNNTDPEDGVPSYAILYKID